MIADVAILSLAMSLLVIMARFANLAKALMMQLLGKNMIGALRGGKTNARPPQAVAAQE